MAANEERTAAARALWFWSAGDTVADVAEGVGLTAGEVRSILTAHGCEGADGRERAAGLSARMLADDVTPRWIAVEREVVGLAITTAERRGLATGATVGSTSDIERDRLVTVPLLLGLARAVDDDAADQDAQWRAAGRRAETVGGGERCLLVTRRLGMGMVMASAHPFAVDDGLILLEVVPDAWLITDDAGRAIESEGDDHDVARLHALVAVEAERASADR